MRKVGIFYNESGMRSIMKSPQIDSMEQQIMMQKLSQVKAEFFSTFGFEGSFDIKRTYTNSRRSRTTYRIVANDGRTTAALKRQPGWLAKFI